MSIQNLQREQSLTRHWFAEVSKSALSFERRWTWMALRRVDPEIHKRLSEQRDLYDTASITGTADEVELQGAALCRGYAAAVRVLEAAGTEDDAYVIGQDPQTGYRVVIGDQKAAADRVHELHGDKVVWITPDEVATLMASVEGFKAIGAVKQMFPGAEIVRRHRREDAA